MYTDRFYLYRHVRKDKNVPFYVGVGTKRKENYFCESIQREFERAYSTHRRSKFWQRIVNKTEYEVEIMLESTDYGFILEKEKEFVNLYGRRDLEKGPLCNLEDGGNQPLNRIITDEIRENMSKGQTGRIHTEKHKRKIAKSQRKDHYLAKAVIKLDPETLEELEEYESMSEAARSVGLKATSSITGVIRRKGRNKTAGGFKWKYKNKKDKE